MQKDEIKEILDKLKDNDWYEELDLTGDKWIELKQEDTKILLDHITNLQEEKDDYKHKFWEEQELNEYLQDRIDKAIEYIKEKSEEVDRWLDNEFGISYTRYKNIIDELRWKPIEEYEKPKYDWVLVKYFIEPNFECIPCVAENRFGKWYDRNDNLINGEVRYFADMQLLDTLGELKGSDE